MLDHAVRNKLQGIYASLNNVNCIVYALPADADLHRLLAALTRDVRVKSAQPLFDFAVASDR
jgi:hypothetical protein